MPHPKHFSIFTQKFSQAKEKIRKPRTGKSKIHPLGNNQRITQHFRPVSIELDIRPNDPEVQSDQKTEDRDQLRFVGWALMRSNAGPQTGWKTKSICIDQIANSYLMLKTSTTQSSAPYSLKINIKWILSTPKQLEYLALLPLLFAPQYYIPRYCYATIECEWSLSFLNIFLSMSAENLNSNLERFGGKLFSSKWVFNIFWELWRRGGDSTKEMSTQNSTNMKLLFLRNLKNKLYVSSLVVVS